MARRAHAASRERLTSLREVPAGEEKLRATETARDVPSRSVRQPKPGEPSSRGSSQTSENAQQLRGEIAVAEERLRNAMSRRERAEEERSEGDAIAGRVSGELERASMELAELEAGFRAAEEALKVHAQREEQVRANLSTARANVEEGERVLRELREELHRAHLERQSAERERDEVSERRSALEREQAHLFDAAEAARRELAAADDAAAIAATRVAENNELAENAREALQRARERGRRSRKD